jgi:small-conductance mechanosensitive channel
VKVVLSGETYRKLCVVVAVAVFSSNFANYSERWGYKPLYWVGLLGVLTAPLLAGAALTKRVPIRPLMVWCAGFLLISIAWYFPSKQNAIAYQEVETRFLSVIFLLLVLFLCARPAEQHLARVMIALSVLLGVGLNLYEVFHPLTFSKIPGRSSGLFENSNQSGAALILGMIIAYAVVPSRVRLPFIVLTGIGILTTFSRAAMIGWILVVLLLVVRAGFGVRQARALLVFGAIVVAFIFSPLWGNVQGSLEERGILNLNVSPSSGRAISTINRRRAANRLPR